MPDLWLDVDAAVTVPVNLLPLLDDTDGKTIEPDIAYDAAGMDLVWHFVTCAGVITATAVTPTTAGDYDWSEDLADKGTYKIEIPASGGASINNDTEGFGWFTGVATGVLPWRGPVIGFRAAGLNDKLIESAYSATRGLGGTALPDAAAEAAGGLYTRGTGAGQINQAANGQIDANTVQIEGGDATDALTAAVPTAGAVADAVWDETLVDHLGGGSCGNALNTIKSSTTAILADTGTDGVVVAAASKTGYALSAAGVQAIWDALTSALVTAGSIGKWIVDYLTGDIFARLGAPAGASVSADIAAVKAQTAAIETDTQDLQTQIGTAGDGLTAVASAANLAIVDTVVDAILADTAAIPTATQNADALLTRDMAAVTGESSRSPLNALRALRNKVAVSSTDRRMTVYEEDDATQAWTADVVTDSGLNPITSVDPT